MVVIERYGKPVASIIPFKSESTKENLYPLRNTKIAVSNDFDEPMPELWKELAVAEDSASYSTGKNKTHDNS